MDHDVSTPNDARDHQRRWQLEHLFEKLVSCLRGRFQRIRGAQGGIDFFENDNSSSSGLINVVAGNAPAVSCSLDDNSRRQADFRRLCRFLELERELAAELHQLGRTVDKLLRSTEGCILRRWLELATESFVSEATLFDAILHRLCTAIRSDLDEAPLLCPNFLLHLDQEFGALCHADFFVEEEIVPVCVSLAEFCRRRHTQKMRETCRTHLRDEVASARERETRWSCGRCSKVWNSMHPQVCYGI